MGAASSGVRRSIAELLHDDLQRAAVRISQRLSRFTPATIEQRLSGRNTRGMRRCSFVHDARKNIYRAFSVSAGQ